MSSQQKTCLECGTEDNIHMHHITYEPEETVPLCASCHRMVHQDEDHELHPEQDFVYGDGERKKRMRLSDYEHEQLESYRREAFGTDEVPYGVVIEHLIDVAQKGKRR